MTVKSSLSARLLAAAGMGALASVDPAAPAPGAQASGDPAVPAGLTPEAEAEVAELLQATAASSEATGVAAGIAQANERVATVFASPEALANPKLAAFLLTETGASADKVVEQLKAQAPAAAPAANAPAAPTDPVAPAQPTVASMQNATPNANRDPGNNGDADDKPDLGAVFSGVDFSGKSSISEDRGTRSVLN